MSDQIKNMPKAYRIFNVFICVLMASVFVFGGTLKAETKVGVGSQLRQNILNAIRPRLEAEAQVKVRFDVKKIKVNRNVANVCVIAQNLDGTRLDMKKTILAEVFEGMKRGDMDGIETGLQGSRSTLIKRGGKWFEVAWSGGPKICDQ